jgi:peptidoglycan-N-acetylglucosamine deacetylase
VPTTGRVMMGLVGAGLLAQALPAVTTWGPMRNRLFPVLSGRGRPDHVALTFDDGPDPESTPRFLDMLDRLDVRATFFMLAECAVREPVLTRRVAAEGHEVALHGWDHRNLLTRGPRSVHISLARGRNELAEVTGSLPLLFRPAYGVLSGSALLAAGRLGMRTVLWTGWGKDWTSRATASSVLDTLAPAIGPGATLLLHDSDITSAPGSWQAALGALPQLVANCRDRGLQVGRLADHGLAGDGVGQG